MATVHPLQLLSRLGTLRARYHFIGRFNALPVAAATKSAGQPIVGGNRRGERVQLTIYNQGSANGYISHDQQVSNQDDTVPPGSAKNYDWPHAPQNAIFAVGDAGADLRVSEVMLDNTPDNTGW